MPVPTDACRMDRDRVGGIDQDECSGFDEVVTQVFGVLQGCIVQPDQAEALCKIANGMVIGIGYD